MASAELPPVSNQFDLGVIMSVLTGTLFFLLAVGIFALEFVCRITWYPLYYRVGIPLFSKRYVISDNAKVILDPDRLHKVTNKGLFTPFTFRQLSLKEYAFVESRARLGGKARYTPIMRGFIRVSPDGRVLIVRGYVYFSAPLIWLAFGAVLANLLESMSVFGNSLVPIILSSLIMAYVIVVLYILQAWRFNNVGRIAAGIESPATK